MKLKNKIYLIGVLLMMGNLASIAQNENIKWYSPERLSWNATIYNTIASYKGSFLSYMNYCAGAQYMFLQKEGIQAHFGVGLNNGIAYYLNFGYGNGNVYEGNPLTFPTTMMTHLRVDFSRDFRNHIDFVFTPLGEFNNKGDYNYHVNYMRDLNNSFHFLKLNIQPAVVLGIRVRSTKRSGGFIWWPLHYKIGIQLNIKIK